MSAMQAIIEREVPECAALAEHIGPRLARLYAARGVTSAQALDYRLSQLPRPDGLGGIDAAAKVLAEAIIAGQRLLVVGDFDADGATSCALALRALREMGASAVDYLVPNRFEFGYGLSAELVNVAQARAPDVILTVDNGISSHAGVDAANALGISVVITDHHLPAKTLPAASAIVNPHVDSPAFESNALAGVGVCFYVMLAVRGYLRAQAWFTETRGEPAFSQFLDLVALGTIADVVPLDRVNRLLVEQGLRCIRADKGSPGIRALLEVAGRDPRSACASDLGFAAAPRLNAAGRMADIGVGIETLLANDAATAKPHAQSLEALNQERRAVERGMRAEAMADIATDSLNPGTTPEPLLCLFDERWHQGVVGIVAGRLKELYQRPAIAFAPADNGLIKGSGRSVSGVHLRDLFEAIDQQTDGAIIQRFGGHAMAAGLTLRAEDYPAFRAALMELARQRFADRVPGDTLITDGALAAEEFSLALAKTLRLAGPWGAEFPEPLFHGRFQVKHQRVVGEAHLKLTVSPEVAPELSLDAIAFNALERGWSPAAASIDAVYRLDVNAFRGRESLQLVFDYLANS